jgi:NAD(P)-dependent dehydrogenase (short-subunit alcohol dehydrogenase family)
MSKTIVVTGASSGFGALTVRSLAKAGHTVYAGMRGTDGRNAQAVAELARYAHEHDVTLHAVAMDVSAQDSVDAAIARILAEQGRIDVLVHNAGHMVLGAAEAFTPEQLVSIYDTNVVGAQRVNRAALPSMRAQGSGLLLWVASSSTRGGTPPFLGPYFAAKAAVDALAVSYASEVIRFGIDTALIVPGAYTGGTNHFLHAGTPADTDVAAAYDEKYGELRANLDKSLAALMPEGADVQEVADAIVRVVDLPSGQRPFRTHIDPSKDGSEVVSAVADRIRVDFFHRVGIGDLLTPGSSL